MEIESINFKNGEKIPSKYTCDGQNINPQLSINGIPEGTKSLALIMEDPDATKGNFVHWVLWNIPSDTSVINENSIPNKSVEGINGAGKIGYIGPCPPFGSHRYFFKFFALDSSLTLYSDTDAQKLEKEMEGHILDRAYLMGTYERLGK